jgi:hypothetical protein
LHAYRLLAQAAIAEHAMRYIVHRMCVRWLLEQVAVSIKTMRRMTRFNSLLFRFLSQEWFLEHHFYLTALLVVVVGNLHSL